MKRKLLAALLTVSVLTPGADAAFTDIKDNYTQQAASALAGMGIVSGNGLGQYEPDRLLSRAEFTRLAVAALGVSNVDNYSSYTIFPDVPAGHWASGWVNAAVRHPDFQKNPIISGLGDGTFGPSNPATLGEACTVALRMLGYEQKDIGPYWPNDYVAKARALGLLSNINTTNPNIAVSRGDAAILFRNTLTSENKEGKPLLASLSGADPITDSILVATSETDSSLTKGYAAFYEGKFDPDQEAGKEMELVKRRVVGEIDSAIVGSHGTVIFDKEDTEAVRGFLPDQRTSREIVLSRIEPEGLLGDDGSGFVYIPRNTPLVVNGKVYAYDVGWVELDEGSTVTMHYDENGVIQVISASRQYLNFPILILGINGTEKSIPSNFRIEKDGQRLRNNQVKMYDVLMLNSETRTALVSSSRITGRFDEAIPSFRYPEKIKVLGTWFDVPETFATSFKSMGPGDTITLLFDPYGRVCGVVSDPRAVTKMEGVVTACTDSEVTVQLFNNVTISGPIARYQDKNEDGELIMVDGLMRNAVGQQVRVTQNEKGELNAIRIKNQPEETEDIGNWNIAGRLLGHRKVSPNVQVFEQVDRLVPLSLISVHDIKQDVIPEDQILSFKADSTGVVTSITLRDVTGESWIYGRVIDSSVEVAGETQIDPDTGEEYTTFDATDYRVTMTTLIDGESVERQFKLTYSLLLNGKSVNREYMQTYVLGKPKKRNKFIGLPASAMTNEARATLSVQVPENLGTVSLTDFDGYTGVQTKKGYYPIAEDVPVYVEKFEKCITLQQAKASYSRFTVYADRPLNEGGQIRIIVV